MLDYGIIGNCKGCALINKRGNIKWMCFPDFSSASIFAKILDKEKGGSFDIIPKGRYKIEQRYIENTNVLETYFINKRKKFVVIDFFPRYRKLLPSKRSNVYKQNRLIRVIKPLKGKPIIKINYNPKPDYAKKDPIFYNEEGNLTAEANNKKISLISNINYKTIIDKEYFELDRTKYFIIGGKEKASDFSVEHCNRLAGWTKAYWKKWVSTLVLPEQNRDLIIRSALVLKLLTFSETGAVIAATTTSIPEEINSERTFDYRFAWIRDGALAVDALKKIGRDYEAKRLLEFFIENSIKLKKSLQIMYGIHGEKLLTEKELYHLSGFKDSKPVRIGNAAYNQKQNDIYGELIDIIYLYFAYYKYEKKVSQKYWNFLKHLVKHIKYNWNTKDAGIWEFRGRHEDFIYSKLMCYVGVDRAIKLAQTYGKDKLSEKWIELRDKIRKEIIDKGYNKKKRAFTMFYGSPNLDASVLRMVYHEFLDKDDPRLISTVKKIYNELRRDYLVRRYKIKDDFGKSKSAFTVCSFWLIQALYYIGEVDKAKMMFQKLVKKGNHLGLFSEDLDIKTRKLLGNFPQAYTHIALINTAILLSEWSAKRKKIDWSEIPRKKWF